MLPKIQHPIFSLQLPISKKTVRYRPMLVREEKMLLVAKESKDLNDIINNMAQVVQNCLLDDIDLENLPMAEFEYIFINIRARSVGSTIELKYYDTYDRKIQHEVVIDIDKIKIDVPKDFNPKIMIDDQIGMVLKVPTLGIARNIKDTSDIVGLGLEFICRCIDYIFDAEQIYRPSDYTHRELLDFIESLPPNQFAVVEKFFENLPTIKFSTTYKNSKDEDVSINLTRLEDFF